MDGLDSFRGKIELCVKFHESYFDRDDSLTVEWISLNILSKFVGVTLPTSINLIAISLDIFKKVSSETARGFPWSSAFPCGDNGMATPSGLWLKKASAVGRRPVRRETAEASFIRGKTDQAIPGERNHLG
jgi:hypothetical protein